MALRNIGASNSKDAFYRYKMPKLATKIEGKGNGIKTNIVNLVDVAKALNRDPLQVIKYFGSELGALSTYDKKKNISIVNGAHENSVLVDLLERFITKYVCCYTCKNPETQVVIHKIIKLQCAACGFESEVGLLEDDKVLKKLGDAIAKKSKTKEQKKKQVTDQEKAIKQVNKRPSKESESDDTDCSVEGARKRTKEKAIKQVKKRPSKESEDDDEDSVVWQTDCSVEGARQRMMEQLTDSISNMVVVDKAVEQHDKMVQELKEKLCTGAGASEIVESLEQSQEAVNAYIEALFEEKDMLKTARGNRKEYLAVLAGDKRDQKKLLVGLEMYCRARPAACKQLVVLLKELYDRDVLEEECICVWFRGLKSEVSKPVMDCVRPLVEWLENAEEE